MANYVTGDIFVFSPPLQSPKAWAPFWDCVAILFEFQNSDVDEEHSEWRLSWVAGIALLRTIGHVLAKADVLASSRHRDEINRMWEDWKSDRKKASIFWDFIEKERNNLLKTYTFGATLLQNSEGYYVAFTDGNDAFQLFRQAVYWWRHQLMTLEVTLSK
jgi:hypothetical protein